MTYIKVSVYINEADKWQHRPLHLELLSMLDDRGIANGVVLRAIAGFTLHSSISSTSLVDISSKLPLLVQFIDTAQQIEAVLPQVKEMAGGRLVICETVKVVTGMPKTETP